LVASVWAQGRGRPFWAGAGLALASIKTATMLPFLLLFHRKKDLTTWAAMTALGLGLCLLATGPEQLPDRCRSCLANIGRMGLPGNTNDYSYDNTNNANMIALDHAFYRLGIRDRILVRGAQLGALGLLGLWVAWQVLGPRALPRVAGCCQVTLFSALFLYHRQYDMVILVLPLVYSTGRARSEQGLPRWLFVTGALAMLAVLYLRVGALKELGAGRQGPGNWLVEALILPYGTWSILAAMGCLWTAEWLRGRQPQTIDQYWERSIFSTETGKQERSVPSLDGLTATESPAPAMVSDTQEDFAVADSQRR
jgi:hypothetical protein